MEKIFLAFWWRKDDNKDIEKIIEKDNVILLNLEKFEKEELNKYLIEKEIALPYPQIPKEIEFDKKVYFSWWIIIKNINFPDDYTQVLFILELYLNSFLNPIFKFDRLWFEKLNYYYFDTFNDWYLKTIDIEKFCNFLNNYSLIIKYSYWLRDRIREWVQKWDKEAFRLYIALWLYKELKNYCRWKSIHYWEKEVMEMWIIFETLFTDPNEKESIWYILRKRIHFLLWDLIENVETKIKEIYNTRSNFVHWSFFEKVIREYEIVKDENWEEDINQKISNEMFEKTKEYITILRKIIFLHYKLFDDITKWKFNIFFPKWKKISCIDVIELSMFNNEVKILLDENVSFLKAVLIY